MNPHVGLGPHQTGQYRAPGPGRVDDDRRPDDLAAGQHHTGDAVTIAQHLGHRRPGSTTDEQPVLTTLDGTLENVQCSAETTISVGDEVVYDESEVDCLEENLE
ncbi:MAG: hypothetical protein ACE367_14650 [Acidimicrobiales bacterium]